MQREASIEDQVRLCMERVDRERWMLTETYADRAQSGASLLRPGLQALMADARTRQFDVVVAEALDRISRDQEHIAGFFKRMGALGITIVTLAEGEIGHLHIGLKGTMNALFLKDLAEKTRRGLRGRVEEGKSGGGNSFGYQVVHELQTDGSVSHGDRRIKEEEASIVRRIFQDFADGKSPRKIALALNAEGAICPRGANWGPSTINGNVARGTGILNNELYVGRLVWNRLRYSKDPDTGKRVSRLNPQSDWITREVPELRIIDDVLWQKVKDRQAKLTRNTRPDTKEPAALWLRRRPKTLFAGLIRCGVCNGAYNKISATMFGCWNARNKGTCDNRLNIRRDRLEEQVLSGLSERLLEPELYKVFAEEFYGELNRLRMAASVQLGETRRELAGIDRKITQLVDAIMDGGPAKALTAQIQKLEARQEELSQQLDEADTPPPLIHPALPKLYRQKVAGLRESLAEPGDGDDTAQIIRSLVEAIVLTPEGGRLHVELREELAGILALCADAKKPGQSGTGRAMDASQIKMVAGAGFEPAAFRL